MAVVAEPAQPATGHRVIPPPASQQQRCVVTTKSGRQCTLRALRGDAVCYFHSTLSRDERDARHAAQRAARAQLASDSTAPMPVKPKPATARRQRAPRSGGVPRRLASIFRDLEHAAECVQSGSMTPAVAVALAQLAGSMVKCYEAGGR
jgi:type II secretory pathway component HofQ